MSNESVDLAIRGANSIRFSQKVCITSLNSNLTITLFGTIYGFLSKFLSYKLFPTSLLASFSMPYALPVLPVPSVVSESPSKDAPCPLPTVFKVGLFFPLPPSLCCVIQYTHLSLAPFTSMNTLAAHALFIYWNYIQVDHLGHRVEKGKMACSTTNGARS
jgi:hypothetical protein